MGLTSRATMDVMDVNSEPALVLRLGGELQVVFVLAIDREMITGIRAVRNPDKLAYLKRQLAAG